MFNLLMKAGGWNDRGEDSIASDRLFEHTDEKVIRQFRSNQGIDFNSLKSLPSVFMPEAQPHSIDDQLARVGSIIDVRADGGTLHIHYAYDASIPPLPNSLVMDRFSSEWGIDRWEPRRTHWAIKTADLYRSLLRFFAEPPISPSVFAISSLLPATDDLVSVMMPLSGGFDEVYSSIKNAARDVDLRCERADEIWTSPAIMQDVVELIARSTTVVADCTGKNPNVFYEMGIAHTIGRSVIPIAQNESDIPFDITHLRYIPYLNNKEGRQKLREDLSDQLKELTTR